VTRNFASAMPLNVLDGAAINFDRVDHPLLEAPTAWKSHSCQRSNGNAGLTCLASGLMTPQTNTYHESGMSRFRPSDHTGPRVFGQESVAKPVSNRPNPTARRLSPGVQ